MKIPQGYTQEEVLADIKHVTEKLSRHFKFGYYTIEDIQQEGCIFALDGLKRYNPTQNTSLRTFLYTHVRNRFINMRRNQCFLQSYPCSTCGFYDKLKKESLNKCREFQDKKCCVEYMKWYSASKSKGLLITNGFIDHDLNQPVECDLMEVLYKKEIFDIIDQNLPFLFREDYCRFMQGARLSKERKQKLICAIQEVLREKGILEEEDG